jgi:hypothetical protein
MVYEVPAAKRSLKQNLFEFKVGSKSFSVPKFEHLAVGVLEAIENAPDNAIGPYLSVFGEADSPIGKAIRTLDKDQLTALVQAWQADSGVAVGESGAS